MNWRSDAEKILEEIKEATRQEDAPIYRGDYVRMSVVESIIRKHINSDWIPVEERLPGDSLQSVIGWDEYRERCCFVQYREGRWVFGNDTDSVKNYRLAPVPRVLSIRTKRGR